MKTSVENIISKTERNQAEQLLVRSFLHTQRNIDAEFIVVSSLIKEKDCQDFLSALKFANVDKFILANTSTGLMGFLHFLLENDCSVVKSVFFEEKAPFGPELEKGLLIKIN